MASSKSIPEIVRPTACALTVSEFMNLHSWNVNIPPVTYLNGSLPLVAGLSIVVAHDY